MRIRKSILAAGIAAAIVASMITVAVAGAIITSSSGSVIKLNTAPTSVKLDKLENATSVFAFDERQGVTLASNVAVDAVNPGTYTSFPSGNATVAKNTIVDSHLIHSDIPSRNFTARRQGSVTFGSDILGVIASTSRLAATDSALGSPTTQYAGTTLWRGLESGNEHAFFFSDKFSISANRRTVTFDLQTYVMDELRVITAHTNPLTATITGAPDPVQAGGNVTYTITVTNNGSTTAANVQFSDVFPGTFVSSSVVCGGSTSPVTCTLGDIPAGASAVATIVVTSPPDAGPIVNTVTAPPGGAPSASVSTTVVSPKLDTTINDAPDPVTAGNDVQYTLTVTNNGLAAVADAHVSDTLPAGTTLKSAPAGCTGSTTVDCPLGALAVGGSAEVKLLVTTPNVGTVTNSAVASPGTNTTTTEDTTVEAPEDGVSKGFVEPGGSLTIPGHDPATITLPDTGDGAPVVITQGAGTFCNNLPCIGTTTNIAPFAGYSDPANPIHLTLTWTFNPGDPQSTPDPLTAAAQAYNSTIYKHLDTDPPNVGTAVPDCAPTPRVAADYACIESHSITQPTLNHFAVSFEFLYLSGDPGAGRR